MNRREPTPLVDTARNTLEHIRKLPPAEMPSESLRPVIDAIELISNGNIYNNTEIPGAVDTLLSWHSNPTGEDPVVERLIRDFIEHFRNRLEEISRQAPRPAAVAAASL